jgi:hypothetical protein
MWVTFKIRGYFGAIMTFLIAKSAILEHPLPE